MLDWTRIDTVLLDMDGTLLDLHFDSHFWMHHVPSRYGQPRGLDRDQAWLELVPRLDAVAGTLDWYCLDYWSRELGLDILALKHEVAHLICYRDGAREFLQGLRERGIPALLVTNAHRDSLSLKLARTGLDRFLDATVCSHDLGHPKERQEFWQRLRADHPFDPARTLFVDDSLPVLRAARDYGIAHLLAVADPDSRAPRRDTGEFPALADFADITP